tara:strand:- start:25317 stop:25544 length:228 start_codon:yes stop_codon:yes gene_type:complete
VKVEVEVEVEAEAGDSLLQDLPDELLTRQQSEGGERDKLDLPVPLLPALWNVDAVSHADVAIGVEAEAVSVPACR